MVVNSSICYRRRKTDKSWRQKTPFSVAESAKVPRSKPWISVSPFNRVKGSLRPPMTRLQSGKNLAHFFSVARFCRICTVIHMR